MSMARPLLRSTVWSGPGALDPTRHLEVRNSLCAVTGSNELDLLLEEGRTAYSQQAWAQAFRCLSSLEKEQGLAPKDLETLAATSYMLGDVQGMLSAQEKAFAGYIEDGHELHAARVALWVASGLASRGKFAEAGGWVERGSRLLEPVKEPCVEKGYLLLPQALRHVLAGEFDEVVTLSGEAAELGRTFGDHDLLALASQTQARAFLEMGKSADAFRLLDEVMLSVISGDCSPMVTGLVYCSVLEGCYEAQEVHRAVIWTESLAEWCGSQPELVAFTDQCLAHRSEILRLQGDWDYALVEARKSHEIRARGPIAAQAFYQQAEIHRMRGEFDLAEEAYNHVAVKGGEPQPGLALLRLQAGNEDAAVASIRRALVEITGLLPRARLLPGVVEVFVEAGHLDDADSAAEELSTLALQTAIDVHQAGAAHAKGVVALARSSPAEASSALREAMRTWERLGLPFELARARRDLGRSLQMMGDLDGAVVQLEEAREAFHELGAKPFVQAVELLLSPKGPHTPFGLTAREVEVLTRLASGATNRSIAAEFVLSERTIDRHVSNIFTKLGVSTRAAATAAAIRNGIA